MSDERLLICAVLSVVVHYLAYHALDWMPAQAPIVPPSKVEVRVIEPEPPKEPPKEPEPKPPEPTKQPVHEAPRPHAVHAPVVAAAPKDTPPPDHPAVQTDTTDEPVFGVTMESTSQAGTGSVAVGNTLKQGAGSAAPGPVKPLAQPVQAFEATKLPLPQGRCYGKYTDEARAAGIEGTVVLDLIVGEDGRVRDVQVAEGLSHGLTEAAVKALRECRFSPGEKDGKPVPVKIRGFKIHFVLQDAN